MGTDTGGSVRLPAAVNGLYGYKPSRQVVSLKGVHPLSNTFDSAGPLTKSYELAARTFDLLRSNSIDQNARAASNQTLRFGIPSGAFTDGLDNRIQRDFESTLSKLETKGHTLVTVDMRFASENRTAMIGIVSSEAHKVYRDSLQRLESIGDPQVLRRMRASESLSEQDISDAHTTRETSVTLFGQALRDVDVMLAPTVAIDTPTLAEAEQNFDVVNPSLLRNTTMINLVDGCAMSMPVPVDGEASPAALMVAAANGNDDRVLGVSDQIRQALDLPA